ncbi:MAG: methyltransferase domain-containing protein [Gammaproteobacteria bacterium]|nr:methyltransferase domain-containing protein [Gammaproteobacteria bacterium]
MTHPMMPVATHDERAEQCFVRDLKIWMAEEIDPLQRKLVEATSEALPELSGLDIGPLRKKLLAQDVYRSWLSFRRTSQEMMWDAVGTSIDRQLDELTAKADVTEPLGSVTINPDFKPPRYIAALDVHMMPGGYTHDRGEGDIRQGAMIDRGGAVYMLGRNGGLMNDIRGHTTAQHLFEVYPDLEPKKILDLGCAIGASTVAVASYFPDAQTYGVDVGAAMLRYAHARAEHLGQRVHYVQANAEHTDFPDESFDFVYSCVLLHETSKAAARKIFAECHRLLRPGGVVIHCEVPPSPEGRSVWTKVLGDYESLYNNEPFWRGVQKLDLVGLMRESGFSDVKHGFQASTAKASRDAAKGFSSESSGVFRCWMMVSARK